MFKDKKNLLIVAVSLVLVLFFVVFFIIRRNNEKKEIAEIIKYEQKQLEEEYSDFNYKTEESNLTIENDSLFTLLDNEKVKVQQLLEELKTLKSSNIRRLNELRKELSVVRGVMRHYIVQLDSLNNENKKLLKENTEIRQKNQQFEQTLSQLSQEKELLMQKVNSAAMLEVSDINLVGINNLGRTTTLLYRFVNLKCSFSILKNKTASVGKKTVYLRIVPPNGNVLTKDTLSVFSFEDKEISYSCQKEIEYEGENMDVCLYWQVTQPLAQGIYRVEIFLDGNLIGEKELSL